MAQDQNLLSDLHQRGIKLRLSDGRLQVHAPPGALTADLRERLRLGRDELIALLRRTADDEKPAEVLPQPAQRHEPFPLTDIQHAYWVGRGSAVELGGVSSHYYFELEREGLELPRLNQALRKVIARHDMLRAVIRPDGRQQVLVEAPPYEIPVADLRELPAALREKELVRIRGEMDHQVLPGNRRLFEIRASRLGDLRLRLHISLDVLILDGLSLYLLFREWRRFYEDPDWSPEPLELTFRDYVLHEQAARAGARYQQDEEYWLGRLDELPAAPALPLARQPAQLDRTRFTRRQARLTPQRWTSLREAAQQRGLTASAVLMTAFAEALRLWSPQPSFTLNLTLFNRPSVHPQINDVVGDFTSVVLLAVQADPAEAFAVRAARVQQQLLRDLEHLSYGGVRVLRERARRLGNAPGAAMPIVFTSALALGSGGQDPFDGIRFFGEEVYGITQTPQVWLDHQAAEEAGGLVFNWDAVEELFPAGLLDDMFDVYQGVLDRLSGDPAGWDRTGSQATLPAWQAAERGEANATAADIAPRTLCGLIEEQAARTPDAPAVLAADGQVTYRQVVVDARRLARRLRALGAEPNTLVGVVVDKSWQQVPAVLGVNLAGAAYLPVDPNWPEHRRNELFEQGRVTTVVTTPELRGKLSWPAGIDLVTFADSEVREAESGPLPTGPAPDDLAYVIFTSGSTGRPKGVMIDHRGAANTVQDINSRFAIGPDDRVLALSALSFDLSVYDVFGTLAAGAAVVLPAPDDVHNPRHWAELVDRHRVTVWNSVPALMQAAVDARTPAAPAADSPLRLVLLSGDWIPVTLPDAVRAAHPRAQVISLGGATEASIWSVAYPIGEVPAAWSRIPYGKPLANQSLHVYDDRLEPCPVWTAGELYIGGAGVALGYWADPERTAERFVRHPVTGDRLYRTGDLGRYLPGGDIEFLGRQDSQVKLNGYRIELGEIAAALRRQPGVAEAVVGVDTNPATGRRALVAHIVPERADAGADADEAGWQPAVAAAGAELGAGLAELAEDIDRYRVVWRILERLCLPLMARNLGRLGCFQKPGESVTAAEVAERGGVKPHYRGLIGHWLAALAAAGTVEPTGRAGEYRCPGTVDTSELDAVVADGLAEARAAGGQPALVEYFAECSSRQLGLLRGEVSPLQLLLPGGDSRVTDALYATNPVSRLQNRITAQAVRRAVDGAGPGRKARVLEIGAGTGSTSGEVLAALPADRVEYRFTDVSRYFTDRAKSRFEAYPFITYGTLDIDREPAGQGFPPGSADVVVAANVLHDAKDLDPTLERLRRVLAPGGLLVAIEGTVNSVIQLVTVSFIEGLSQETSDERTALLTVPQWRERAERAGFVRFASVPEGEAAVDVHVQHVLLAQAPDGGRGLDLAGLRPALERVLPEYMVPRHFLTVDRLPLSANGKVDRSALPSPWEDLAADERLAPRDEWEQRLFAVWQDALKRDDFGVEDNFFELGGDSLHAVAILGRLRDDFGLGQEAEEGLELLFDHPTIAELAELLRDRSEG
ncbi:amino acid adenylation domain-containing protein [Kitasatospora sp. NPDC056531]|uniref:non-ribosomal peptide synthetase n=1 Tax=Kitasatospora sp. NPDC056531 TaxID=3345856 RepID=UPI0036776736